MVKQNKAIKSRESLEKQLAKRPKQYSLHYHTFRMMASQRNSYDPEKKGATITDSSRRLLALAKSGAKEQAEARSQSLLPSLAEQSTL